MPEVLHAPMWHSQELIDDGADDERSCGTLFRERAGRWKCNIVQAGRRPPRASDVTETAAERVVRPRVTG